MSFCYNITVKEEEKKMTKEEEQQILDELGIEKPTVRCGTYRMPDIDLGEIQSPGPTEEIQNKSTGRGGVFDGSTYEGDDIPLDFPTFISVRYD